MILMSSNHTDLTVFLLLLSDTLLFKQEHIWRHYFQTYTNATITALVGTNHDDSGFSTG